MAALDHQVFIAFADKLHGLRRMLGVDVAKVDILEAFSLPDVVVVWNVDADGSAGAGKCNDVQTSEVRLQERILLENLVPRQLLN